MDIVVKSLDEIKQYARNPRKNNGAVEYVANSIKEFGFKVPIVIDKNNVIIAGHTRYKAAKEIGLLEVPCIVADDLTDEQVKAFRLASWDKPNANKLHPTMKPVGLFDYQIKNNTKGSDIVLDLFGGSGTTVMACEQNGRKAYVMELDPRYVDVIIKRWEDFTGEKAVLLEKKENGTIERTIESKNV